MTDPAKQRRITLADVAAQAGVSRATASRALAGDPRIRESTREAVRKAADALAYVPDQTARNLRARRKRSLGLLLSDLTDPDHSQVGAGFEAAAAAAGYSVLMVAAQKQTADERRALTVFQERRTDGVCIASSSLDPAEVRARVRPAPLVVVQPDHPGLISEFDRLPEGTMRSDDVSGFEQAFRHLLAGGYRDIAYLGAGNMATNTLRRSVAERVLGETADRPMRSFQVTDEAWRTPELIDESLGPDLPEAFVCYDDKLAIALLDALRTRGVRVPDDVGVVGYDGIPFAAFSNPRLTTVAAPAVEMGSLAARSLIDAIESGTLPPPRTLPVELVVRESSVPAWKVDPGVEGLVAAGSTRHDR